MIGQVVFQRSAKEHRKGLGAFANAVHVGSQMIGYIDEQVFREAVAEGASLGHVAQGFLAVSFANGECPEIIDKIRMRERESAVNPGSHCENNHRNEKVLAKI